MTPQRPGLRFTHIGVFATDVDRQARFYKDWLDFTETDRGLLDSPDGPLQLVFLSRDPDEHHQLVFISGRPAQLAFNTINQISMKADSLATLRAFHRRLQGAPVTELVPVTHGNALSLYFRDPEGNRVELYVDTPWYVSQPCRVPAPFDLPEDELMAWAEAHARTLPGFRPRSAWRQEMAQRMGVATPEGDAA
jgi:catechol 2,3-dioxygenase-like lactoylglutathione lyase family enzyme